MKVVTAVTLTVIKRSGDKHIGELFGNYEICEEKSRVRETPTLSTDADSRTDTNFKRLRD